MKTWTMMAAMFLMALCVAVAQAEDKKAAKATGKKVVGEITAIDTTAKTLTIKPKEGDAVTANLTDTTKVKIDGKDATVADLKVGQKGAAMLDADGANVVAVNIGAMKPHGEGKK